MMRRLSLLLGALCPLAGCAGEPSEGPPLFEARQPIFGGEFATACQWPSAIISANSNSVCTATLIHPRLVLTAAHCLAPAPPAYAFGETASSPARRVAVERCVRHPNYRGNPSPNNPMSADVAFCLLRQEVSDVPIVPLMSACEVAAMTPGHAVTLVGYGVSTFNGRDFGRKRFVTTKLVGLRYDGVLVGEPGKGGCSGDSGGPAFFEMSDGSWRVIGPASITFGNPPCMGSSTVGGTMYMAAGKYVDWIEQTSGLDVTACHDNGVWSPGAPGCKAFPTDPGAGGGAWANGCQGMAAATPAMFCSGSGMGTSDGGSGDAVGRPPDASRDLPPPDLAAPSPDTTPIAAPDVSPDVEPRPDLTFALPGTMPGGGGAPPQMTMTTAQPSGCSCELGPTRGHSAPGGVVLVVLLACGVAGQRRRSRR